jgi:hypothetical protein
VLVAQLVARGSEVEEEIVTAADQLREQGRQQGAVQEDREILLDLLGDRFGALPDAAVARVMEASSAQLRAWIRRVLRAAALDEVLG